MSTEPNKSDMGIPISQPSQPTESEIAMSHEIWGVLSMTLDDLQSIIARHNAPLHRQLATQKSALELAQKAIEKIEWAWSGPNPDDYKCPACRAFMDKGHEPDCIKVKALAAVKEALQ